MNRSPALDRVRSSPCREHACIRRHRHFRELKGLLEGAQRWQERDRLDFVALERLYHEREPRASVSKPIVICESNCCFLLNPG